MKSDTNRKKQVLTCFGLALTANLVFYTSYYCGLLYEEYTAAFVVAGGLINIFLLTSRDFSKWAEKTAFFGLTAILLAGILQAVQLHIYVAEIMSVNTEDFKWGSRQLVANCIWFGQAIISILVSLAATLIIYYRDCKNIVE